MGKKTDFNNTQRNLKQDTGKSLTLTQNTKAIFKDINLIALN